MIKEFKGYSFSVLMDNDLDPNRLRSWTKMNKYMHQDGDTAFNDDVRDAQPCVST